MRRSLTFLIVVVLALSAAAGVGVLMATRGSGESLAARDPTGEPFPSVTGESLDGVETTIPGDFAGTPVVLLVGYEQRAQFDIDRWLMGLLQAEAAVTIVEVPTIPGIVPTVISGWIDEGMRSGIPREDWSAVVTLYGSAARPVAELTGTERGEVARVIVLDTEGRVAWFDDTGYSARKAIEVAGLAARLSEGRPPEAGEAAGR